MAVPYSVFVARANNGVLMFQVTKKYILENFPGIQIGHAAGGSGSPQEKEDGTAPSYKLRNIRFGFDTFRATGSISGVNVSQSGESHCTVFVNFESWEKWNAEHPGRKGEECWYKEGNMYQPLLRALFNQRFAHVKVRKEGTKISLRFSKERSSDRIDGPIVSKVVFAPSATERELEVPTELQLRGNPKIVAEAVEAVVPTPSPLEHTPASMDALAKLASAFRKNR